MTARLPIEDALPELKAQLARHRAAVLEAPPGAGKTTLVPLALLDEPWVKGKKILMLEPRRIAARAAAARMSALLGESVGETRSQLHDAPAHRAADEAQRLVAPEIGMLGLRIRHR